MSPIGRIFVVINLVLAAVFLGAGASFLASTDRYRTSYEEETVAKTKLKEQLEADLAALETQKAEAERIREEMRNAKTQLETELAGVRQDLEAGKIELAGLKENNQAFTAGIDNIGAQLSSVNDRASEAEQTAREAIEARNTAVNERQAALAAKAAAEDKINELMDTVAGLEKDLGMTMAKLQTTETNLATAMDVAGLSPSDIGTAEPKIDGAVLSVTTVEGAKVVFINRGKTDSVKPGYVFEIFAGSEYKGQAKVEIVHDTTCTARLITANPGTTVMQGDRASTRI